MYKATQIHNKLDSRWTVLMEMMVTLSCELIRNHFEAVQTEKVDEAVCNKQPLLKKTSVSQTVFNKYKPVSILVFLGKVVGKLMTLQLARAPEGSDYLDIQQSKHKTETALAADVGDNKDQGSSLDAAPDLESGTLRIFELRKVFRCMKGPLMRSSVGFLSPGHYVQSQLSTFPAELRAYPDGGFPRSVFSAGPLNHKRRKWDKVVCLKKLVPFLPGLKNNSCKVTQQRYDLVVTNPSFVHSSTKHFRKVEQPKMSLINLAVGVRLPPTNRNNFFSEDKQSKELQQQKSKVASIGTEC
ncbi:hypothetical protein L345_00083, partial [Ophiophagus hannah]